MSNVCFVMKLKVEIRSAKDLGEDALLRQISSALVEALSALFAELLWQETDDGWFGSLDGDDTRYEFRIDAEPDYAWSVHTSHRRRTQRLIPVICNALDVTPLTARPIS